MTQEEKAKAYDEALEKARVIIKDYQDRNLDELYSHTKENFETIFPELKESKDEKIRKLLWGFFSQIRFTGDITQEEMLAWLEKHGDTAETPVVSIAERDGQQWVRVKVGDEDFLIAAHDYKEDGKDKFTLEEAYKIGTFSKKQAHIVCAFLAEINGKLRKIGGDELKGYYWSSTEYNGTFAWYVNFSSGGINGYPYGKCITRAVRPVAAF